MPARIRPLIRRSCACSARRSARRFGDASEAIGAAGPMTIQQRIEELFARRSDHYGEEYFTAFEEFKTALNEGRVRAAEPDAESPTGWKVNAWVKKGILLGFRIGFAEQMPPAGWQFRDKQTYPLKQIPAGQNVRVVPG